MRRFDPVAVQAASDVASRVAIGELLEDAANDLGLIFDYLKLACAPGYRSIAVGFAASMPAVPNNAFHTAPRVQD
ncbi:hypothetical protein [Bradyrhizobium erythrophlei]|uniref:hypothetical protein n=1 Tax=Bradyrhizobium erythrophlei TaxID=1437360 RepID=UPI001FCD4E66|nr:hypothetical protein [Bradyrhizobium erythrophlei]